MIKIHRHIRLPLRGQKKNVLIARFPLDVVRPKRVNVDLSTWCCQYADKTTCKWILPQNSFSAKINFLCKTSSVLS